MRLVVRKSLRFVVFHSPKSIIVISFKSLGYSPVSLMFLIRCVTIMRPSSPNSLIKFIIIIIIIIIIKIQL
jgi:hypothetical protein